MTAPINHTAAVETAQRQALLLASMRVASLNLRTWTAEIDACGIALKSGAINIDAACDWLADIGVLAYLPEPEREPAR